MNPELEEQKTGPDLKSIISTTEPTSLPNIKIRKKRRTIKQLLINYRTQLTRLKNRLLLMPQNNPNAKRHIQNKIRAYTEKIKVLQDLYIRDENERERDRLSILKNRSPEQHKRYKELLKIVGESKMLFNFEELYSRLNN